MVAQDVFFIVTISFACLRTKPKSRPTIKYVSQEFLSRRKPIMVPLHAVALWELRNQETYMVRESETHSECACFSVENHIVWWTSVKGMLCITLKKQEKDRTRNYDDVFHTKLQWSHPLSINLLVISSWLAWFKVTIISPNFHYHCLFLLFLWRQEWCRATRQNLAVGGWDWLPS